MVTINRLHAENNVCFAKKKCSAFFVVGWENARTILAESAIDAILFSLNYLHSSHTFAKSRAIAMLTESLNGSVDVKVMINSIPVLRMHNRYT